MPLVIGDLVVTILGERAYCRSLFRCWFKPVYTNLYPDESRIRRPFEGMPGNGRMMQWLDNQATRVQS